MTTSAPTGHGRLIALTSDAIRLFKAGSRSVTDLTELNKALGKFWDDAPENYTTSLEELMCRSADLLDESRVQQLAGDQLDEVLNVLQQFKDMRRPRTFFAIAKEIAGGKCSLCHADIDDGGTCSGQHVMGQEYPATWER